MGTTLTGTTPQDTYDSLIKVTDNGPLTGSLKKLTDGLGNDSSLSLSTTAASLSGTLAVTGNATFDTNTLFVDAAANEVGIGTATPKGKLDVIHGLTSPVGLGDVAIDAFRLEGGGITAIRAAQFDSINQPAAGDIQFLNLFFNGSTYNYYERMRITAAGNVGIGTSAPDGKLDVVSAGNLVSTGTFTNPHLALTLPNAPTNNDTFVGMTLATSDSANFGWSFGAERTEAGLGNLGIRQHSNSATGTAIARFTSAGLCFGSDTAAANALDDYEEGTWTPSVAFGGASVGVVLSVSNGGTYTKIGRQVTVNGFFAITSKGSSTGAATITGLPFTIGNGAQFYATASLFPEVISFANVLQGRGDTNTTTIQLFEVTEAGVLTTITNADFADTSNINISLTYFV